MRQVLRFFFWLKDDKTLAPRAQYVQEYDWDLISPDEAVLMRGGYAKSPNEARLLMTRYNAFNAHELIKLLPKRKVKPTLWQRFKRGVVRLVMKIEGASYRPIRYENKKRQNILPLDD